jgi:CubicO group peptidase (beta-lactamase class C family)
MRRLPVRFRFVTLRHVAFSSALVAAALAAQGSGAKAVATSTATPASPPQAAAVDAIFAPWMRNDGPGCAVGVTRAGKLIFTKGYGMANLEHGIPITPETVFPIGSNSKQFTATVTALLAEDGKLDVDADVRTYLPELPAYGAPLTARQLVHHTGGLRDYQALRYLSGVPPERVEPREVLALLLRQRGLQHPPGARYEYDNSGYVLQRFLVERVTGKSLPEVAQEKIFGPLGMTHTRWIEDHVSIVPGRATAYDGDRERGFRAAYSHPIVGSGGVLTTVGDLTRWDANWYDNRLGRGGPRLVEQLTAPGALADGTKLDYAWGLFLDEHRGRRIVWTGGTGPGYVADMVRFPAEKLSVFCLCNGVIDSRWLSRRVADVFLDDAPASPLAAATPATARGNDSMVGSGATSSARAPFVLPEATLAALVGRYRNLETGTIWELRRDGSRVVKTGGRADVPLTPVAADALESGPDWGWRVTFEPPHAGAVPRLHRFENGEEIARYDRLPEPLSASALAPYAGRFASDELQATYSLEVSGGALELHTPVQPNGPLLYLGGDSFVLPGEWFDVRFDFTRSTGGGVDGFGVDAGTASGIRFGRQSDCR